MSSTEAPRFPRFPGGFLTWSLKIDEPEGKPLERRLRVFSNGKRGTVFRYLWLKYLWDELTSQEYFLFISLPETIREPRILAFLKLRAQGISKITLRKSLVNWETLVGELFSSRETYQGLKGLRLEIWLIERRLRPAKKYTGYVKSISALGRGRRGESRFELLSATTDDEEVREVEFFVEVLTVGGIPQGWTALKIANKRETET